MARPALVCLTLVALLGSSCAHTPVRQAAYGATLLSMAAVNQELSPSVVDGHIVLVQFFATWCFPCLGMIPGLVDLQRELGPKGLQVVGVGMDLEGAQVLQPFADHYHLDFPVLVANDVVRNGESAFGPISQLPVLAILDRRGKLVAGQVGPVSMDALKKVLHPLLAAGAEP